MLNVNIYCKYIFIYNTNKVKPQLKPMPIHKLNLLTK